MNYLLAALLNIALLTTDKYEESWKPDDKLLIEALQEYDIEAQSMDWTSHDAVWPQFDAVIVYSTWDYHEKHEEFLAFLRNVEEMGVKVYNPPSVIEWNSNKTYFRDLEKLGLKTIESIYLSSAELGNLKALLIEKGWDECVIKPQISASGNGTYRFNLSTVEMIQELLRNSDEQWIIQPFAEEIVTEGEWSFVFFDNDYIHCILKKPNEGEFLVQKGTKILAEPPEWMIQEVKSIAKTINLPVMQMRIDVIRRGNEVRIMEVEMIEPNLYLKFFPGSEKIIAKKLSDKLNSQKD